MRIAVALAEDGVIPPEDAVMRVEPKPVGTDAPAGGPEGQRDVIAPASRPAPGPRRADRVLATEAAQASAARNEPCILVRRETAPEDIRGMHAAEAC